MIDWVQRLTLDELPDCLALAESRTWPPEERKWRLLLEIGTGYGLRDETRELVGTAVLTRYGADLAAISMVLVAAHYGRQGLGRRLMTHALAEAGDATVFLNATEYGRPLYKKLGFVSVGTTHTHVGRMHSPVTAVGSRRAEPVDIPAIAALDAAVIGADRAALVERLPSFTEQLRVVERRGEVTGYVGAWVNVDHMCIGPVISSTIEDAKMLISDVAAATSGPVRLDLDDRHPQLHEWATRQRLPRHNSSDVMVHRGRPLPGDRSRWFAPVMQALG